MAGCRLIAWLVAAGLGAGGPVLAQDKDEEAGRRYTTREERRDAGPRHELAPGLTFSALLEAEYADSEAIAPGRDQGVHVNGSDNSLEAVLEFFAGEWLESEAVWEIDSERRKLRLDEAAAALIRGGWELEFGRLYVPFGEYFSHFASGPLIEFAETRGRSVGLAWSPAEDWDLSVFAYRGQARPLSGGATDWGLALEIPLGEVATLGLSYLSDLADADEGLLEDSGHRYRRAVDAVSGYLLAGLGPVELSFEGVRALERFEELDRSFDQPRAWNLELAVYPGERLGLALRHEESRELEEEPQRRDGLAASWQLSRYSFVTVEYLQGRLAVEDPEDEEAVRELREVVGQLSIAF